MSYVPPLGNDVTFVMIADVTYNPPVGNQVPFDMTSIGDGNTFIFDKRGSSIFLMQPG